VAVDVDLDGDLDLVSANALCASPISVIKNLGDGTFDAPEELQIQTGARKLVTGDFDEDGFPDLVVIDAGDDVQSLRLLLNRADQPGSFQPDRVSWKTGPPLGHRRGHRSRRPPGPDAGSRGPAKHLDHSNRPTSPGYF